ncbi:hypothetical protein [Streptomyces sp. NPDC059994]|uniref:hypothetical protein n=1 Tax=Streptomyces sp. NPDC059994 TaxID=3347029 RepID=UPI0036C82EC4
MDGIRVGRASKEAFARRRRERDAAVAVEVQQLSREKCGATDGEQCSTAKGLARRQAARLCRRTTTRRGRGPGSPS